MSERFLSCCFTGYRPQKFPFSLTADNKDYIDFENRLTSKIVELIECGCLTFCTGMAMGFDIIAAECVMTVAAAMKNHAIRLICAIPFPDQARAYPPEWKARYNNILAKADKAVLISDTYYPRVYFDRNRFMVDNSDFVLTWFDGSAGGTANTVNYANSKMRKVINLCEVCND